jgi:phosphate starvation-inducible protein PhoH
MVELDKSDVIRHKLVESIIDKYDKYDKLKEIKKP